MIFENLEQIQNYMDMEDKEGASYINDSIGNFLECVGSTIFERKADIKEENFDTKGIAIVNVITGKTFEINVASILKRNGDFKNYYFVKEIM